MSDGFSEQQRNQPTQFGQPIGSQSFPNPGGYQQPQYPQQPGPYPPQQQYGGGGRPPNNNTAIIVLVSLAVVVAIVGAVVTIVLLNGKNDDSGNNAAASSSVTASSSAAESTDSDPTTTTSSSLAPVVPGHQAIKATLYNAAYDVPASWKPASSYSGMSGTSAAAVDAANYCPGSSARTVAYMTKQTAADANAAANAAGRDGARIGYRSNDPITAGPQPLTTANGKLRGTYMEFTGPWAPSRPGCTANRFSIFVFSVAMKDDGRFGTLTVMADRGTDGEVDEAAAKRILTSLRAA